MVRGENEIVEPDREVNTWEENRDFEKEKKEKTMLYFEVKEVNDITPGVSSYQRAGSSQMHYYEELKQFETCLHLSQQRLFKEGMLMRILWLLGKH